MIIILIGYLIKLVLYVLHVLIAISGIFFAASKWTHYCKTMCTCKTRLDGKVVIITGGNAGLGYETAKRLARHGARIVLASRNLEKSKAAAERITHVTGNPDVKAESLDLTSLSNVKQFVDDFNKKYERLDILINNAGLGKLEHVLTEDGIELVMQVNHVGPVYLTHLLLDKLVASKPSRIIFVSSGMHRFHLFNPKDIIGISYRNFYVRYMNSKICNVMSARGLAQLLPEGVTVNSLNPGATDSEIYENIPFKIIREIIYGLVRLTCKTVEECAQTTVHVALAPSLANVTGKYFEECKVVMPIRAGSIETGMKVWDDTVKLAEEAVQRKVKET